MVVVHSGKTQTMLVSGLVLEAFVGPRPKGYDACHADDNPLDDRLVNLRWDTHSENMMDVIRQGRHNHAGKPACKNGHKFTPANTITRNGKRSCRECGRAAQRRYSKRRRREVKV